MSIFAEIDQGQDPGAVEYKTFDNDAILGKPCPDISHLEFLETPYAKPEAGKVTVMFMWGQYHKPGYKYFPLYSQLAKKYGDKVTIVGISIDPDISYPKKFIEDPAGKYSKVFTTEFAMAWDNGTLKKAMMEASNKRSFSPPQTFVIDAKGIIVWFQDHSELGATAPCYLGLMEEQIDALVSGAELKKVGDRPVVEVAEDEEGEEMNIEMGDDDDPLGFL